MTTQQTPTELSDLMEAALDVLERAPCDCPDKMRHEDGRHLSHCHLFDLNMAVSATQTAKAAPVEGVSPSELLEAARLFHNLTQGDPEVIIRPPSAAKRDAITAAGQRLRDAIQAAKQHRAEFFIGESEGADFEADTWTFKMQPGYSVGAGFYRIEYIGLSKEAAALPPGRGMVPMSVERIKHLQDTHVGEPTSRYKLTDKDFENFARAIEFHHGIKEGS